MSGDVSCRWCADWACVPSFGIPAKIHNRTRHRRHPGAYTAPPHHSNATLAVSVDDMGLLRQAPVRSTPAD
jgi:hypothetical protein